MLYLHFKERRWLAALQRLSSLNPSDSFPEVCFVANDYFGGTAFFYACYKRAPLEVIEKMVEVGRNFDKNICAIHACNNRFPLHYSLSYGASIEVVKLLVRECPFALRENCIDFDDCCYTPLMMSEANDGDETIRELLRVCTKALESKNYDLLAQLVKGDAYKIRRMCISPDQLSSENARVALVCCLKHGYVKPNIRTLDVKLAVEMLPHDCWVYLASFL